MESVANQIMKLRVKKGISKADMARACGMTQTAYANIEEEKTKSISIEVGKKIAIALNIGFIELFDIDRDNQRVEDLRARVREQTGKIEELKERIVEKDILIKYFSRSNHYVRSYFIKRMREDFIAKWGNYEGLNRVDFNEDEMWKLIENEKKKYEDLVSFGVLEPGDVDHALKIFSRKKES